MILNRKVTKLIFIALFTYVNVPFYFVGITSLHKAAYYALALIPIFLAVYRGGNNCKNLSTYSKLFLLYVISIFLVMIITGALSFDYLSYFVRLLMGCFASISIFCILYSASKNILAVKKCQTNISIFDLINCL